MEETALDVLAVLRHRLERSRAAGTPFPDAWAAAVGAALTFEPLERERRNWEYALNGTRFEWSKAYVGVAPAPTVRACQDLEDLTAVAA
jgi:hypothetical protein